MEELWELRRHIEVGDYDTALRQASFETCEGIYTTEQLAAMHERHQVLHDAWTKVRHTSHESTRSD